jgi:hypothetical protein
MQGLPCGSRGSGPVQGMLGVPRILPARGIKGSCERQRTHHARAAEKGPPLQGGPVRGVRSALHARSLRPLLGGQTRGARHARLLPRAPRSEKPRRARGCFPARFSEAVRRARLQLPSSKPARGCRCEIPFRVNMAVTISTGSDPESCSSRGSADSVPSRQNDQRLRRGPSGDGAARSIQHCGSESERGSERTKERASERARWYYKLLALSIFLRWTSCSPAQQGLLCEELERAIKEARDRVVANERARGRKEEQFAARRAACGAPMQDRRRWPCAGTARDPRAGMWGERTQLMQAVRERTFPRRADAAACVRRGRMRACMRHARITSR